VGLRFGTDGVRGVANTELTPEYVMRLARVAARLLGDRWALGADTRRSGPLIQAAFAAGLAAEGARVELLGVVPTPAVAYVAEHEAMAGAMVSASHNPFQDNGIKLFAPGGLKLPDDVERRIEEAMEAGGQVPASTLSGSAIGTIIDAGDRRAEYLGHLAGSLDGRRLDGLRVVLDTANGAASSLAPEVFRSLGADVTVLHDRPDGCNINEGCGAMHPEQLQRTVLATGAEVGLAFDGDADRLIAVDERGELVDGDHVMAICALDLRSRGRLRDDTVVVTVMTNLGFRQAMEHHGVSVVETAVGDRYVLAALDAGRLSLGGEQSGHVIFRDLATTGDGLLTGLQLLDVLRRRGQGLAATAASSMTRLPQVLVNVRVKAAAADVADAMAGEIAAAEQALAGSGRVLVRPSGTEPLLRVMVEAPTAEEASAVAETLADAARRAGPAVRHGSR
jgi:phosphoglucosamine mutase